MAWYKFVVAATLVGLTGCTTEIIGPAAVKVDPVRSAESHTRLASGYFNIGRPKVALEEINAALTSKDDYAPAWNVRGLVYMSLKENDEAARSFRKALDLDPGDSDTNHNYGVFLCQTGKEEASIEYFIKAAKNPLYATPERSLSNAGLCLRKLRKDAEARELFERALRLQPTDRLALFNLAELAYRSEDYLPARGYLQRIPRAEQTPETLLLAWRVERALGDAKGEKRVAEQLIRDFPTSDQAKQLK